MPKTEKHQCSGKVWHDLHYYPCSINATVERDGKWYCGIHDPVKVKEREEKTDAEYRYRREIADEKYRRVNAERHYCSKMTTDYLESHQAEMPDAKD